MKFISPVCTSERERELSLPLPSSLLPSLPQSWHTDPLCTAISSSLVSVPTSQRITDNTTVNYARAWSCRVFHGARERARPLSVKCGRQRRGMNARTWIFAGRGRRKEKEGEEEQRESRTSEALIALPNLPSFPTHLRLTVHLHSPRRRTSVEDRCDSKWSRVIKTEGAPGPLARSLLSWLWRRVANVTEKKEK